MKERVQLQILGDICPDWGFRKSFDEGNDAAIFGDLLPLLQQADFTLANLECPLSDKGQKATKTGPCLRGKASDMAVLKRAGIDAVSLANNHILDYGQEAFLDTLEQAKRYEILTVGANVNAEAARKPLFVEKKGVKIGVLAFGEEEFNAAYETSGGANLFDPYCSLDDIKAAKSNCDYLIVLYHGGIEHYELPSPLLQKKCRKMVQCGADLVLCQHSHCIGTYENYQNATILYGQGNAIFGRFEGKHRWNRGLLVTVELGDGQAEVSYRVFEAQKDGVCLLPETQETERLSQLKRDSENLDDPQYIKTNWDAFCEKQASEYLPTLFCWGRIRNKLNRVLKNKMVDIFVKKRGKMVAMNLVRCDAHREVVQTILENSQK